MGMSLYLEDQVCHPISLEPISNYHRRSKDSRETFHLIHFPEPFLIEFRFSLKHREIHLSQFVSLETLEVR